MKQFPIILAIDTSCDDTSVAITQGMRVLSNIVASQTEIHRIYGGVYPLAAKLAHHELINPTYQEALKRAKIKAEQIDAVAVTYGPGLAIALEVGIEFAKQLAKELNKPLIAVNHMAGHLYSPLAVNSQGNISPNLQSTFAVKNKSAKSLFSQRGQVERSEIREIFPALALLVSGGHSEMILLYSFDKKQKIGQTVDDAAGEALDKFARLLDLGYPGAAAMEEIAKKGDPKAYSFPLPMTQTKELNFSFSGLKTAGRQQVEKLNQKRLSFQGRTAVSQGSLTAQDIANLAASFQNAVFKAIFYKLKKAIDQYEPRSLWLGGGVSANIMLRQQLRQLAKKYGIFFLYPKLKRLNGDNAAMIGIAAYFKYSQKDFVLDFDQLQRVPRLSL